MQRRRLLISAALSAMALPAWAAPSMALSADAVRDQLQNRPSPNPVTEPVDRTARPAPRIVVLDWGLMETLLALGVTPVGAAELDGYRSSVVTPPVPSATQDVGLRLAPSLELLQQLSPDLILINSSQESQRALLEHIAPVKAFAIYSDAGAPYRHAQQATLALGTLCHRERAAQNLIDGTTRTLAAAREALTASGANARALYLITFFNEQHVGVYGAGSVFQDVMDALGVVNAWRGATSYWGIGVAGLAALAASPNANVRYFAPLPGGVARSLASNRLWQALPAVAARRVASLPPFWGFGMLPAAARFADALQASLQPGRAMLPPTPQHDESTSSDKAAARESSRA